MPNSRQLNPSESRASLPKSKRSNVFCGEDSTISFPESNPTQTWGFYPQASWHVALDPNQPETAYFVESGGVQRTTNGGGDWKTKVRGMQNTCVTELLVDPANPKRLFSTQMDAGLLVSHDNGNQWAMVMPTNESERDALGGHYYDIIAAQTSDATAYFQR